MRDSLFAKKQELDKQISERNQQVDSYWVVSNKLGQETDPAKRTALEAQAQKILLEIERLYPDAGIKSALDKIKNEEIQLNGTSAIGGDEPYQLK